MQTISYTEITLQIDIKVNISHSELKYYYMRN